MTLLSPPAPVPKEEAEQTPLKAQPHDDTAEDTRRSDSVHVAHPVGISYNEADEEPPLAPAPAASAAGSSSAAS